MFKQHLSRLAIAIALVSTAAAPGCGKKDDAGAKKDDVTWPAKPADDTPLVFQFVSLEGTGDDMKANLRVFNFTDKSVKSVQLKLHYLDASGKEVKSFPWGATSPEIVGPKGTKVDDYGAFLPPETKTVNVTLREVKFADGSTWTAKAAE
ncbi:MAG: hypothetical protein SFX73_07480 [Kofleriaceae bacterium]|nr:hypothetical protein [Kofleriaceae bacterium]